MGIGQWVLLSLDELDPDGESQDSDDALSEAETEVERRRANVLYLHLSNKHVRAMIIGVLGPESVEDAAKLLTARHLSMVGEDAFADTRPAMTHARKWKEMVE